MTCVLVGRQGKICALVEGAVTWFEGKERAVPR
jgi:hypothetical protein